MNTIEKGMGVCSLTEEQRKMVEDNHNLVYVALKQYSTPREYEDAYGVMAEGLCNAARKYDPSRGVAFSTYAVKCMWRSWSMVKRKERTKRRGGDAITISLSDPVPQTEGCCVEDLLPDGSDFVRNYEQTTLIQKVLEELGRKYMWQGRVGSIDKMYVFRRVCIEGAVQSELAKELGVTQGTISRTARRVKRDLLDMLEREGIGDW